MAWLFELIKIWWVSHAESYLILYMLICKSLSKHRQLYGHFLLVSKSWWSQQFFKLSFCSNFDFSYTLSPYSHASSTGSKNYTGSKNSVGLEPIIEIASLFISFVDYLFLKKICNIFFFSPFYVIYVRS